MKKRKEMKKNEVKHQDMKEFMESQFMTTGVGFSHNMFNAYRDMQPNPLRKIVEEVTISKKHKVDHLLSLGLNQIDTVKNLFVKSFIQMHEKETPKERQKAIEKA